MYHLAQCKQRQNLCKLKRTESAGIRIAAFFGKRDLNFRSAMWCVGRPVRSSCSSRAVCATPAMSKDRTKPQILPAGGCWDTSPSRAVAASAQEQTSLGGGLNLPTICKSRLVLDLDPSKRSSAMHISPEPMPSDEGTLGRQQEMDQQSDSKEPIKEPEGRRRPRDHAPTRKSTGRRLDLTPSQARALRQQRRGLVPR